MKSSTKCSAIPHVQTTSTHWGSKVSHEASDIRCQGDMSRAMGNVFTNQHCSLGCTRFFRKSQILAKGRLTTFRMMVVASY
eukprot:4042218-Amphidinium_carterae.1